MRHERFDDIVSATGWQLNKVRVATAGALKKKLGLEVIQRRSRVADVIIAFRLIEAPQHRA